MATEGSNEQDARMPEQDFYSQNAMTIRRYGAKLRSLTPTLFQSALNCSRGLSTVVDHRRVKATNSSQRWRFSFSSKGCDAPNTVS